MTPPHFRRTLARMAATFEEAFARAKQLVASFRANEKFYLSPAYRCDGLDRQIDALGDVLCGLTAVEIKTVEGVAS
jgi:hypothetical protein